MHPGSLLAVLGLALMVGAFAIMRRRQLLSDTPTSRCIGVFMGWNEVKGQAWHEAPTTSHFSHQACVRWSARVLEENRRTRTVTSTDANGNSSTRTETYYTWDEIDSWSDDVGAFYVVDESGGVLVDPQRATVHDRVAVDRIVGDRQGGWFAGNGPTGRINEVESLIEVGDSLYVTGAARLRDDAVAPVIDSDDGGPFVVSTKEESQVTRSWRWGGWLLLVVSIGAIVGGSVFAFGPPEPGRQPRIGWPWLPGAAVAAIAAAVGGLVLLYNGHVRVANRVERAWSLIDVMLQRRHDLGPALVVVVDGAEAHEAATLEHSSMTRSSGTDSARTGTETAAAQTAVLREVIARAEAYPELQTDANFRDLQLRLSDTEDRIAAARKFHNDSVTSLRDRMKTFPGILVAGFVRNADGQLFAAEGFERSVPAGLFPTLRAGTARS